MDDMNGCIAILGDKGWAVTNQAVLDYEKEIVNTPEGRRMASRNVFALTDVFGELVPGEKVKVAFEAEDGKRVSYLCGVESRTRLVILKQLEEYKQILERVLSWQTE